LTSLAYLPQELLTGHPVLQILFFEFLFVSQKYLFHDNEGHEELPL